MQVQFQRMMRIAAAWREAASIHESHLKAARGTTQRQTEMLVAASLSFIR